MSFLKTGFNGGFLKVELRNKNVLVIGAGKSGISVMKFLRNKNANVYAFDEKKKEDFRDSQLSKINEFSIEAYFETLPEDVIDKMELIIVSPGVPLTKPYIKRAYENGIEVIGEVELAYRFCRSQNIIAITGTNGKTTTTTLVGEILKKVCKNVIVCGNIGNPFIDYVDDCTEDTIYVIEISSFQLETIKYFKPKIAAILNITPDHLNRHLNMENYARAKMRIFENVDESGFTVLNFDNDQTRRLCSLAKGNVVLFSKSKIKRDYSVYVDDDFIFAKFNGNLLKIMSKEEIFVPGDHNLENSLAAIACILPFRVSSFEIEKTLKEFKGVEHRIEFVREVNGIRFYNDSKGTNTDASEKALKAFNSPIILIAGGYDKGEDFEKFAYLVSQKVKKVILLGQTKDKIAAKLRKINYLNFEFAKDLKEAVDKSYLSAQIGDVVLLSPACASWDMFENYEQRGRLFKEYVNEL